jgi:hypothetical protein
MKMESEIYESIIMRMNKWLLEKKLPKDDKLCLENFVLSCENLTFEDIYNFVEIDTKNFSPNIRNKLIND